MEKFAVSLFFSERLKLWKSIAILVIDRLWATFKSSPEIPVRNILNMGFRHSDYKFEINPKSPLNRDVLLIFQTDLSRSF